MVADKTLRVLRRQNIPDDLAVNGARDAVLELQVHLGDGVLLEDGSIRDITCGGCQYTKKRYLICSETREPVGRG